MRGPLGLRKRGSLQLLSAVWGHDGAVICADGYLRVPRWNQMGPTWWSGRKRAKEGDL